MGNQKYIVSGKICPKCGAKAVEFSNFGDEEIETCLECGYVLEESNPAKGEDKMKCEVENADMEIIGHLQCEIPTPHGGHVWVSEEDNMQYFCEGVAGRKK